MKNFKSILTQILLFFIFLITGCVTHRQLASQLDNNLNACLGKMTTTDVLMFASSPTDKELVKDGEIWIYKYGNSITESKTTGTGGFLIPYHTTSTTVNDVFSIMLHFNEKNILTAWNSQGHVEWTTDAGGLSAQKIPFFWHSCNNTSAKGF